MEFPTLMGSDTLGRWVILADVTRWGIRSNENGVKYLTKLKESAPPSLSADLSKVDKKHISNGFLTLNQH